MKYDIENMSDEELWKQYQKYRIFADEVRRRDILAREEELKNKPPVQKKLDGYRLEGFLSGITRPISLEKINPINDFFANEMLKKYNLERFRRNKGLRFADSKKIIIQPDTNSREYVFKFLYGFMVLNGISGLHKDKKEIEIDRFSIFSFDDQYKQYWENNGMYNVVELINNIQEDAYNYYTEMVEIHILPFFPKWYFQLKTHKDIVDIDDVSYNQKTEEWVDYYREENKYDEIAYHQ